MQTSHKKILLNVTYYSLIALMVGLVVILCFALPNNLLPLWAKICYYIVTGELVMAVVLDIIMSNIAMGKYIVGWIIYALSITTIALGIIMYLTMQVKGVVPTDKMGIFDVVIGLSVLNNIFTIIIFALGENISVITAAQKKKVIK